MKNYKKYILTAILMGLLLPVSLTRAEDIDIYDSNNSSMNNPNILIVLDNSSNWAAADQGWPSDDTPPVACGSACNKQGYYELKALRELILKLDESYGAPRTSDPNKLDVPLNIGLMMFNNTTATRDGGYVRSEVQPMTHENRAALVAKLDTIISNFNTETTSSSVQYSAALFDAFKYFGGFTNPANATTDLQPSPNPTYQTVPVFGKKYWGTIDADGTKPDLEAYHTDEAKYDAVDATSCGSNYLVFIGNGFPSTDVTPSSNMGQVLSLLTNPANPTPISQFDLKGYAAGSTCSNVAGFSCSPAKTCAEDLISPASGLVNSEEIIHTCNQAGCPGSQQRIQACNVIAPEVPPTGSATGRFADEFTNFLNTTDVNSLPGQQKVITYAIDVYKDHQDLNQTALMRNMATYGGGKYFGASDLNQLGKAFDNILAEIQSVNSVFSSSSLPVSVNTQGTYLNQVFVGMFRPDPTSKPRWLGNLKQYQFKIFGGTLRLADFAGQEAINSRNGFITPCATSAWSTDTGSYWQFSASSAGLCDAASKFSDLPDGDAVEKGGAAQRLRGTNGTATSTNYASRNLKTCADASCTSLDDFNTSHPDLTAAVLGVTSGTEADLINWVRGQDVDNENNTTSFPNTIIDEVRPSVHGGVVHSQPAVVDYGGGTGVVAFYGADDGVLHAINGNKSTTDGNELWGFIAPETYSKLKRLRENTTLIKFPTSPATLTPTPQPKDYFFDGSVGVFQQMATATSPATVWIYPTMRRGGRAIYAFDVTTPANPVLKWRKGCFTNDTANDSDCTGGWAAIGQTWSKPQVTYLSGYVDGANNPKPVLVFGGGYDTCEDTDSQARCSGTRKGANIWFVDADTGTVLRTYPTNYSVPGEVAILKDSSGNATYAYAADTGGYVYRINLGTYSGGTFGTAWSNNSSAADITIADLGGTNHALKFLFGPDVVPYLGYNAVLIGSGDREHPLATSYTCNNFAGGVQNQFFMVKDTPTAYPASPATPADLTDVTTNLTATESAIGDNGWRFNFANACEQAVNKSLTLGGVTYFGTNAPKTEAELTNACGPNLGNARGYAVSFLTGAIASGTSRYTTYPSGGLPPSPVGGIVDIDGVKTPFCIGCTKQPDPNPSPLQGSPIKIDPSAPRQRVYWYLETD